jgi:osmotically-inducible protein OsmY
MKEAVNVLNFYRPPRPDDFIHQEIIWSLGQSGILDPGKVKINVERGVVKLVGEVYTPQQKRLVGACVQDIPGVRHVENQLKILRISRFRDDHSMHGF